MNAPLYRQLLGERYGELAPPLQAMHDVETSLRARGRATIERGRGVMAGIIAGIFRFPQSGEDVPLTVCFTVVDAREHWRRDFGGSVMSSIQEAGRANQKGRLVERFGPMSFVMSLQVADQKLRLHMIAGAVFGIPLPRAVLPVIEVFEHAAGGRFNFHVDLGLPLIGRVVRYRGWLKPDEAC